MQNERIVDTVNDGVRSDELLQPAPRLIQDVAALNEQPSAAVVGAPEFVAAEERTGLRLKPAILIAVSLLVVAGGTIALIQRGSRAGQTQAGNFNDTSLPLSDLEGNNIVVAPAKSLKISGALQVSNSVVLTPSSQPSNPVAGQLYFDKTSNQLAFYDGQAFVNVGSSNTTTTTIISSSNTSDVRLQTASPGVQQTGNLNISGVAMVGSLKTTTISSGGGTLYVNPVGATAQQSIAAGTPATAGLATVGSSSAPGPGWANEISATKVTLGNVGGTAVSISVYFNGGSSSNHVQLALYDDDGDIPSKPGALLAASAVGNLVPNGWTTLTISGVNLTANGTYWLAVNTDDNSVGRVYNGGSKASCFLTSAFGFMPDPMAPFGCFYDNSVYSIYLNYLAGAGVSGSLSQAQMVVGPTGQVLFQNTNDSTTALQVQNAAGTSTVLNIDTLNGRIGIGKTTPAYKLDIAAGDINLSNGKSLRFAGLPVLSVNGAGTTTSISNFQPGGKISAQAESFVIQDANATNVLFTADTANLRINIGNVAGSNTPVILYLANKNTAGDPAGEAGGMYYNSSLGNFRCFVVDHWQDCTESPRTSFHKVAELSSKTDDNDMEFTTSGAGSPRIDPIGSEASHPTIMQMGADASGVWTFMGARGTTDLRLGIGDAWRYETSVRVGTLSTLAERFTFRAGFLDGVAGAENNACYFGYSDSLNSGKWQGYCEDGINGSTTCDTGITVTAGTWYRLTVVVDAAGTSADFRINGASACQVNADIPSGDVQWAATLDKNTGTTDRSVDVDYIDVLGQFGTPR